MTLNVTSYGSWLYSNRLIHLIKYYLTILYVNMKFISISTLILKLLIVKY